MGKDVFLALAAIGWADGNLDRDEADAILRAAAEQRLELEDMVAIEAACQRPVGLESLDCSPLSKADRLFVYGVACWMTTLDGTVDTSEERALAHLGELLGIPPEMQSLVDGLTQRIGQSPEGDRPDRYDLPRLRAILEDGLARAAERRRQEGSAGR